LGPFAILIYYRLFWFGTGDKCNPSSSIRGFVFQLYKRCFRPSLTLLIGRLFAPLFKGKVIEYRSPSQPIRYYVSGGRLKRKVIFLSQVRAFSYTSRTPASLSSYDSTNKLLSNISKVQGWKKGNKINFSTSAVLLAEPRKANRFNRVAGALSGDREKNSPAQRVAENFYIKYKKFSGGLLLGLHRGDVNILLGCLDIVTTLLILISPLYRHILFIMAVLILMYISFKLYEITILLERRRKLKFFDSTSRQATDLSAFHDIKIKKNWLISIAPLSIILFALGYFYSWLALTNKIELNFSDISTMWERLLISLSEGLSWFISLSADEIGIILCFLTSIIGILIIISIKLYKWFLETWLERLSFLGYLMTLRLIWVLILSILLAIFEGTSLSWIITSGITCITTGIFNAISVEKIIEDFFTYFLKNLESVYKILINILSCGARGGGEVEGWGLFKKVEDKIISCAARVACVQGYPARAGLAIKNFIQSLIDLLAERMRFKYLRIKSNILPEMIYENAKRQYLLLEQLRCKHLAKVRVNKPYTFPFIGDSGKNPSPSVLSKLTTKPRILDQQSWQLKCVGFIDTYYSKENKKVYLVYKTSYSYRLDIFDIEKRLWSSKETSKDGLWEKTIACIIPLNVVISPYETSNDFRYPLVDGGGMVLGEVIDESTRLIEWTPQIPEVSSANQAATNVYPDSPSDALILHSQSNILGEVGNKKLTTILCSKDEIPEVSMLRLKEFEYLKLYNLSAPVLDLDLNYKGGGLPSTEEVVGEKDTVKTSNLGIEDVMFLAPYLFLTAENFSPIYYRENFNLTVFINSENIQGGDGNNNDNNLPSDSASGGNDKGKDIATDEDLARWDAEKKAEELALNEARKAEAVKVEQAKAKAKAAEDEAKAANDEANAKAEAAALAVSKAAEAKAAAALAVSKAAEAKAAANAAAYKAKAAEEAAVKAKAEADEIIKNSINILGEDHPQPSSASEATIQHWRYQNIGQSAGESSRQGEQTIFQAPQGSNLGGRGSPELGQDGGLERDNPSLSTSEYNQDRLDAPSLGRGDNLTNTNRKPIEVKVFDINKNYIETLSSMTFTSNKYDIPISTLKHRYLDKNRKYNDEFYFATKNLNDLPPEEPTVRKRKVKNNPTRDNKKLFECRDRYSRDTDLYFPIYNNQTLKQYKKYISKNESNRNLWENKKENSGVRNFSFNRLGRRENVSELLNKYAPDGKLWYYGDLFYDNNEPKVDLPSWILNNGESQPAPNVSEAGAVNDENIALSEESRRLEGEQHIRGRIRIQDLLSGEPQQGSNLGGTGDRPITIEESESSEDIYGVSDEEDRQRRRDRRKRRKTTK
jgi:hypothetical protein